MAYFHIVDFIQPDGNQLGIVPESWLLPIDGSSRTTTCWCRWPPDSVRSPTAWARNCKPPAKSWPLYKVHIIHSAATYERAEQMSKRYKLLLGSDLDTTNDHGQHDYNRKRRRVAPRRWRPDPDSSDSDWSLPRPSQQPSPPQPPLFHRTPRSPATANPNHSYTTPASHRHRHEAATDHNYQQPSRPSQRMDNGYQQESLDTHHHRSRSITNHSYQQPSPASNRHHHRISTDRSHQSLSSPSYVYHRRASSEIGHNQPSPPSQAQCTLSQPPQPPSEMKCLGQNSDQSLANTGSEVRDMLGVLLTKLEELEKGQAEIKKTIQTLLQRWGTASEAAAAAAAIAEKPQLPEGFAFPLSSSEELKDLESLLLSDKHAQSSMEQRLGAMGGRDVVRLTFNIMGSVMANALARRYNLQGTKGKMAFNSHHTLLTTIREGVRKLFPEATDVEVNQAISKWLTGSRDRDHGRRDRYMARFMAKTDVLQ